MDFGTAEELLEAGGDSFFAKAGSASPRRDGPRGVLARDVGSTETDEAEEEEATGVNTVRLV